MPKLSNDEIDTFLADPGHLVRIGTTDSDGMPRVTPTWFIHRDGMLLFTPRQASVFLANVRRDPRISLLIDETALPYRKVNVAGHAEIVHDLDTDDVWRDTYRAIAGRYIEPDAVERYIQSTIDQTRALLGVRLTDAKVTSWRMPVDGEPSTGIWARRYYADDTHMARLADDQ
jgi:PPOX class probable F420-dependent enzyme